METEERVSVSNVSTLEARVDPRSPMSAGRLNASTMSMRAKAKRKREANAQHNSNFRAGYVPVDEDVLHRSGIRGRKRYFLYCTIVVLFIVALLNALVTAWLIYLLGLTHNGMMSIQFTDIGSRHFMRVFEDTEMASMSLGDRAFLGARYNTNLSLTAAKSSVLVNIREKTRPVIVLEKDGNITMSADDISIYSENSGSRTSINAETIADSATNLHVPETVVAFQVKSFADFKDLSLESIIHSVGMESKDGISFTSEKGVKVGTNTVSLEAQGGILLDGQQGVYVDPNLLEIATSKHQDPSIVGYKLCVCETGRVFKVLSQGPDTTCDLGHDLYSLCGT